MRYSHAVNVMAPLKMLLCAADGWVEECQHNLESMQWRYRSIKKYQRIPIYCLADDQVVYTAKPNYQPNSGIAYLLDAIFNRQIQTTMTFGKLDNATIEDFKAMLKESVENDDDLLTQFAPPHEIVKALANATNYMDIKAIYVKFRWID